MFFFFHFQIKRDDQTWSYFFVFTLSFSIFEFLINGCFFYVNLVSAVLVKILAGKSIAKMTYFCAEFTKAINQSINQSAALSIICQQR